MRVETVDVQAPVHHVELMPESDAEPPCICRHLRKEYVRIGPADKSSTVQDPVLTQDPGEGLPDYVKLQQEQDGKNGREGHE